MGSDMAMEKIHIERYARWEMDEDEQVLAIYRRHSYDHVEQLLWKGQPTEDNIELIRVLVAIIPDRPTPVVEPRVKLQQYLLEKVAPYDASVWNNQDWLNLADEILRLLEN